MAATVLESPRPGRDPSKIVQMVFPVEDETVNIEAPSSLLLHDPLEPQGKPRIRKAPVRTTSIDAKVEALRPTTCNRTSFPGITALLAPGGETLGLCPTMNASVSLSLSNEADLRGLKQKVQSLPRHHPLRFALKGEPDRMSRAELALKLIEWAKYLAWQER